MFASLRSRLLLTYLAITALVLTLVSLSLLLFVARNPIAERTVYRSLRSEAAILAPRIDRALQASRLDQLQTALSRLDQRVNTRALVLDHSTILADSRPVAELPPAGALAAMAASDASRQGEYRDPSGARWLYVIEPLSDGRTLALASPRPTVRALVALGADLFYPVLEAAAVALVTSVLLAWLLSRWVAAPLQRAAEAARAVAAGNYDHQVPPAGPSEVHGLAVALNHMIQKVKTSQQSQRDFVANVSHELKTPLTSIQGFAQAILDGTAGDSVSTRHAAEVIYGEADRLRRLVVDLLDLARLDAGQMSFERHPVDVSALIRSVCERLSLRATEKGVGLDNAVSGLPTIVGDGDRLAQVFTNLLDNAIKHTPGGQRVSVRAETSAGWIAIHVEDRGPGIPPEELPRIFERFYQVDKARSRGEGRGAGLGLAISSEIVQAHGGTLTARNLAPGGSRFRVQLPIAQPQDKTLARRSS
ncbi:MAG: HAMP domain-containing histidine kinase [Actinobacteria bacterium]|nr:HAMP domain-containing histidine kinase [Actinomycetota bacterium]